MRHQAHEVRGGLLVRLLAALQLQAALALLVEQAIQLGALEREPERVGHRLQQHAVFGTERARDLEREQQAAEQVVRGVERQRR